MNPNETPPHEEENFKSMEPLLVFAPPIASAIAEVPEQRASRGTNSKLKEQKEQKYSKDPKSNSGKQVASSFGRKSSKHGKAANGDVVETLVEDLPEDIGSDIVESNSKNDPVGALISRGTFGVGNILGQRLHIVERSCSNPVFMKIINKGIADFLKASDRSQFDTVDL